MGYKDYDEADWWKSQKNNDEMMGDNHPELPKESKRLPPCPRCGSYSIGYMKSHNEHKCFNCHHSWKSSPEMLEKKIGGSITYDNILDFHNEIKKLNIISEKGIDFINTYVFSYLLENGRIISIGKRVK